MKRSKVIARLRVSSSLIIARILLIGSRYRHLWARLLLNCSRIMAKIDAFFNLMFEQKASDLHLSSGNPPMLRINGELQRVDYPPLENDSLKAMLYETAPDYKMKQFEET